MRKIKGLLDRLLSLFQIPKNNIQPNLKEKLPFYDKQMFNFINSNRRRGVNQQVQGQQQFPHSGGNSQSMPQPSSQASTQQHDGHGSQISPLVVQGSVTSMQSTAVSSMQNGSMPMPTHVGVPSAPQNIMNALQSGSTIDSSQGVALTSLQEGGLGSMQQASVGSFQQTTFGPSTQSNMHTLSQTNSATQQNMGALQQNTTVLQQQVKQEHPYQQLMQSQQMKQQMQQRQMQHQKQQILQQQPQMQQQYQQQQKQPQSSQLQAHQMPQLHHINEMNDLKSRQASAIKPGLFQQHFAGAQRQAYHQQLKPGASFPISSPQNLQVPSPQISQHSSPQVEQALLSSLPKAGTPLQSTNSPFIVPSPSTPLAPSPLPGDHEKQMGGFSSLSNASNIGHQQASVAPTHVQSLAVGTPGISASPLLAEYIGSDGSHANAHAAVSGKPSATEKPIERLVKAVRFYYPLLNLRVFLASYIFIFTIDRCAYVIWSWLSENKQLLSKHLLQNLPFSSIVVRIPINLGP